MRKNSVNCLKVRKTITYDQGHEMAEHKLFTKETNIEVYFAHPEFAMGARYQ